MGKLFHVGFNKTDSLTCFKTRFNKEMSSFNYDFFLDHNALTRVY